MTQPHLESVAVKCDLPKHFMVMALSKMIEASGYVRFATAKNDECPLSILNAHRERKYSPIPAVNPANIIIQTPINTPMDDIAAGIATKSQI
jgi:hypothetical protein